VPQDALGVVRLEVAVHRLERRHALLHGKQAGDFVVIELGREAAPAGLELQLGDQPKFAARELKLELRRGGAWSGAPWVEGRTRVESQRLPASQVLLLTRPRPADAVRLSLTRGSGRRWGIAELRLWETAP